MKKICYNTVKQKEKILFLCIFGTTLTKAVLPQILEVHQAIERKHTAAKEIGCRDEDVDIINKCIANQEKICGKDGGQDE